MSRFVFFVSNLEHVQEPDVCYVLSKMVLYINLLSLMVNIKNLLES